MDGILIIDKPAGLTSHDVVARARRILRTKRVGHTGTLDPFATGVLVLLIGKATRLAQFLDKDRKTYEAVVRFGFETDTGDLTGEKIGEELPSEAVAAKLAAADWESFLTSFRGEHQQVPPMYSAKKIDGKKLYELARAGEFVERAAVTVNIYSLSLEMSGETEARIIVESSAGTYIRTLAEDIGRSVGAGAHLTQLRRTKAGKFSISEAITLDELAEHHDPYSRLVSMEEAVASLASVTFPAERIAKTLSGLSSRLYETDLRDGQAAAILDESGALVAVGFYRSGDMSLHPKIVLR